MYREELEYNDFKPRKVEFEREIVKPGHNIFSICTDDMCDDHLVLLYDVVNSNRFLFERIYIKKEEPKVNRYQFDDTYLFRNEYYGDSRSRFNVELPSLSINVNINSYGYSASAERTAIEKIEGVNSDIANKIYSMFINYENEVRIILFDWYDTNDQISFISEKVPSLYGGYDFILRKRIGAIAYDTKRPKKNKHPLYY